MNIKHVQKWCLKFDTMDKKYYQITAIDEYSRKRILEIVDEKSVTNTNQFVNNQIKTDEPTLFERTLETLGIKHKRTRPYSPWQNGKVKGNHKIDGKRFYSKQEFKSVENKSKKI